MTTQAECYRELAAIVARHAAADGEYTTAIPRLLLSRRSSPSQPLYTAQKPVFGLVVQGAKSIAVGRDYLEYGVGDFLVVALDVPIVSRVTTASRAKPNLAIGLEIDAERFANMFSRLDVTGLVSTSSTARGVAVSHASPVLLDSILRLFRLLERPKDISALAPLYEEEILYRLLTGPCASQLLHVSRADTLSKNLVKATKWLRDHFDQPLRIEDLARRVGMSVSSLHHHFKAVTALSPLQYQKQLRLNDARRLMLVEHLDVATASDRVGYQSPSQFTREYTRMFGRPPRRDVRASGVAP